jgi:sterol desaturase/sphingolipid hydroxylase (fatty acid hydroxylase superfamily)
MFSNAIVYHLLHHARFDGHYGFGTAMMDRALGTEWPDWRELHLAIMDGAPLTSLRQKGARYRAVSRREPSE